MRMLLGLALAATVVVLVPSSADAAGGRLHTPNLVQYEGGCQDYTYSYNVGLPDEAVSWSMDVEFYGRDGLRDDVDFVYDEPNVGSTDMLLCLDGPGRYRAEAVVTWYDSDYNEFSYDLPASSLVARAPRTRVTMKATPRNPRKGAVVKLIGTVRDERPRGYFPTDFAKVVVEAKRNGKWAVNRKISGYTNDRGKVVLKGRFDGKRLPVRLRVRPASYDPWAGSVSKPFVLR